ncbi:hypothetical protein [Lentisalinibacter salinarum]|uniref:hypothetical protein n=1 Tax=Lentisalinibacter salinarum TaxID=2992239 RepID=UPI00386AE3DD
MNIKSSGLALATALLLAGCAANGGGDAATVAQADNPAAGDTQAAGGGGDKPKLICKEIVKTGTRFSETVCATQEAWDGASEFGQKATEDIQRRPAYQDAQSPPGGG